MKKKIKNFIDNFIVHILLFWLAFHVLSVAFYLLPESQISEFYPITKMRNYTAKFFSQKWTFFAPLPGIYTDKIWVACTSNFQTKWFDPVEDLLQKARKSHYFSSDWKVLYLHRHVASELYKRVTQEILTSCSNKSTNGGVAEFCESAEKSVRRSAEYTRALNYALEICVKEKIHTFENVKLILIKKSPFPFSNRNDFFTKPYFNLNEIVFENSFRKKII